MAFTAVFYTLLDPAWMKRAIQEFMRNSQFFLERNSAGIEATKLKLEATKPNEYEGNTASSNRQNDNPRQNDNRNPTRLEVNKRPKFSTTRPFLPPASENNRPKFSSTRPFLPPTSFDLHNFIPNFNFGTPYAFNYFGMWQLLSTYLRYTGDVEFLGWEFEVGCYEDDSEDPSEDPSKEKSQGNSEANFEANSEANSEDNSMTSNSIPKFKTSMTTLDYMVELATAYQKLPSIPGTGERIADYGGNLRTFLEVVPTYIHAVPALQYTNVLMLMSLGELFRVLKGREVMKPEMNVRMQNLQMQGLKLVTPTMRRTLSDLDPAQLQSTALSILDKANELMYNNDGTFNSLYPNKNNTNGTSDNSYKSVNLRKSIK